MYVPSDFQITARGAVVYESGSSFERVLIRVGHYPDKRSDAKGIEPESVEFVAFGGTPMVFVQSERGSVIGVYDVTDPAAPVLRQLLPSGIAPEGIVAIPQRNLLVSANEAAVTKKAYRVPLSELNPAPLGTDLPLVGKELVRDLMPDLMAANGYVQDKVEGFAIDAAGQNFAVTDDGVDDRSGETHFLPLGSLASY